MSVARGARGVAEFDPIEAFERLLRGSAPTEDDRRAADDLSCREVDCVRHLLPRVFADMAEWRSHQIDVGADRVLITAGHMAEETYVTALAAKLGLQSDPVDHLAEEACPLRGEDLARAVIHGILPLRLSHQITYVLAPRGIASRRLIDLLKDFPELALRIWLSPAQRLFEYVERHGMRPIAQRAAEGLRIAQPVFSAATCRAPPWLLFIFSLLIFVAAIVPAQTAIAAGMLLSAFFLAWIAVRIACAFTEERLASPSPRIADRQLPTYTIIVALHREAEVVRGLVAALRKIDYPAELLDVKLVLEEDDHATRTAVARLRLGAPFQVIVAPNVGPRTKPKALNIALAFARGEFIAVYDAEDRPDADQLRQAVTAFRADPALACVQARLTIDNTADGWLAHLFTAEYASLFDVLLPAMASRGLPLPLGGSSNHFRTATLRAVGGWDAYNVTEDADLGMRLSRFGHRTAVIDSTTYEEAPARLMPWLRQRTRWFKGWMQTWLVHMREPRRLYRELGWPGFMAFQLLVGGNVLAALVHPLFLLVIAVSLFSGGLDSLGLGLGILYATIFVAGYLASAAIGAVGLHRRGLLSSARFLALMPLHWLLLSASAWRGLHQLLADPHRWEKTEHGHARTSRAVPMNDRLPRGVRYSAAGRRPLPRAAA
jgi:glycosyltransferase XagB